jgi:hypothetical protein
MKADKQLTVGIATAIIAVLVASQSVNPATGGEKVKHEHEKKVTPKRFYSDEEVEFLVNANHWTRAEAIKVLDLSTQ